MLAQLIECLSRTQEIRPWVQNMHPIKYGIGYPWLLDEFKVSLGYLKPCPKRGGGKQSRKITSFPLKSE